MGILDNKILCSQYGITLTGGIGAGKTTISHLIKEREYPVINADEISKKIMSIGSEGYRKLIESFGEDILDDQSAIDRKKLRTIIFNDQNLKFKLESITHPLIKEGLTQELKALGLFSTPRIWFYEAPIIIETNRHSEFKELWLLICPKFVRLERIKRRDSINDQQAEKIVQSQLSEQEKAKFAKVIIDTDQNQRQVAYEVNFHLNRLIKS